MLSNTRLEAAHLVIRRAQKLAHLEVFNVAHQEKWRSCWLMLARALAEAHSEAKWGELMARIVVKESPSRMSGGLPKVEVSCTARRAA